LVELLARAAAGSKHFMIAGIDADNAVSIGLHRSPRIHQRRSFSRGGIQVRALARLGIHAMYPYADS